ncbi:MAG: hypothetical protein K2J38_01035 [Muribaculaceae bacterium]|nr:hypothetical protein [Muribaculaceae bacterium]
MKKVLLTLLAAGAVAGASAANYESVWNTSVVNALEAGNTVFNAPVAVDALGRTIVTGAFTEDITLAGTTLSAVGTSAYIASCDLAGTAGWAVALTGSATISDVVVAADGSIYVSGTFADEVEFGTTAGEAIVKEGMMLEGAPTVNQNASFVAHYDATGRILAVADFVPQPLSDLIATGMYFPIDGDVYFSINHLAVVDGTVYAFARYTGETEFGGASFKATYNDPFGGIYFIDLAAAAVFTMPSDLSTASTVVTASTGVNLASSEGQYFVRSGNFAVTSEGLTAVFSGNGPLVYTAAAGSYTATSAADEYVYQFLNIKDDAITANHAYKAPEAGFETNFVPAFMTVHDGTLYTVGSQSYAENYGTDEERVSQQIFVYSGSASDLSSFAYSANEAKDGDITYSTIKQGAVLPDGSIAVATLGYYNVKGEDYGKGDFAGKSRIYTVGDGLTAFSAVSEGVGIAAAGEYAAFATAVDGGFDYTLCRDTAAGIADITVDNAGAPVEYYNLQGIKIANPTSGYYIIKKGADVRTVYIK